MYVYLALHTGTNTLCQMIGIIVQLAISWLIIWFFEKGNLSILGFRPTRKRLVDFVVFFIITALCCSTGFLLRMYFGNEQWKVNPGLNFTLLVEGVWWNLKSVLFEELIFRGVLFYVLIKKLGTTKAIIISAIAFGIYHWFSMEAWGNIRQMGIIFIITGLMGIVYAYGYAKTFSLYIPCAIHLGWNLTQSFIFSEGVIGDGIFIKSEPQPTVTVSYLAYSLVVFFPLLSAWLINLIVLRRKIQVLPKTKKAHKFNKRIPA